MGRLHPLPLAAILLALGPAAPDRAAEPDRVKADEQLLKDARVASDGPALLEFFRKRTIDVADEAKMKALVRQLGDDDFDVRESASAQLTTLGAVAVPLLKQAMKDPDVEVARRAQNCLQQIERGQTSGLLAAAARLVAARKPAGAAEVLLGYLPFADDETVAEEVRLALGQVAVRDGKVEPALVAGLSDKSPDRRAGAAVALARAGVADQKAAVRKLLEDGDPVVRLRVGLTLAALKDKGAVPVIIDLLDKLPAAHVWQAEDLLYRLAEDKAPALSGNDEAARRKFREAWAKWWADHGDKVDLAKAEPPRPLGYTMVILLDQGKLLELDANNKVRWEIGGLQFPLDAQYLPGDKVLIAEQAGNRVTERSLKGEVLWEKKAAEPLAAQRLPNGNTFITTRTQIMEVDRDGKEVFGYRPQGGELLMRSARARNGEIGCVLTRNNGTIQFVRLDPAGKELYSFPVNVATYGGRIELLPNGRVLIPEMNRNRVVEYDSQGKAVAEISVEQPIVATRLANGHTLVTSMSLLRALELDRGGKPVWEYKQDTRVSRAWRR